MYKCIGVYVNITSPHDSNYVVSGTLCQEYATEFATIQVRASMGCEGGTQISKIKDGSGTSDNLSAVRDVYHDCKPGKYRARLRTQDKIHIMGSYAQLEDAVKERRRGEEEILRKLI